MNKIETERTASREAENAIIRLGWEAAKDDDVWVLCASPRIRRHGIVSNIEEGTLWADVLVLSYIRGVGDHAIVEDCVRVHARSLLPRVGNRYAW